MNFNLIQPTTISMFFKRNSPVLFKHLSKHISIPLQNISFRTIRNTPPSWWLGFPNRKMYNLCLWP